jgi:phosphatidylcholine synthase
MGRTEFGEGHPASPVSGARRLAAWGVHLFTACGAVAGLLAVIAIMQEKWVVCFAWLMVAAAIDSLDGYLARLARVKDVLPGFDGALLDNIIDYFTFVMVPALIFFEAGLLPHRLALAGAVLAVLASSYQFCQADAKTGDHFFKGFPSYWNVVALYLFLFDFNPWLNLAIIVALALLVFVPIKYVYPSRTPRYRRLTVALAGVWGALLIFALVQYPEPHRGILWVSLLYVGYYAVLSLVLTVRGPAAQE